MTIDLSDYSIKYKHLRNPENNRIFATICNIINKNNFIVSIGLALCSTKDNPSRKIGRDISFRRALIALYSKLNSYPINRNNTDHEVIKIYKKYGPFTAFKSVYNLYKES